MINQLLCGVHIAAAAEAMTLAERAGVPLATMHEIISRLGRQQLDVGRPRAAHDAGRSAGDERGRHLRQGPGHRARQAQALKQGLPLSAAAMQMFLAASGLGHGAADDSQVIRAYRALNGGESTRARTWPRAPSTIRKERCARRRG